MFGFQRVLFFLRSLGSAQDKNRLGSGQDEKSQSSTSGCGITPTLILGRGPHGRSGSRPAGDQTQARQT